MKGGAYVVIWEFHVKRGSERAFEEAYGPRGAWARLFLHGDGYLGTELLRNAGQPGRYVTIDRWVSQAAYEAFRSTQRADYEALDRSCAALTVCETALGSYRCIGP
jgi:heme-degrading monooxygenase HmoA